MLFKGALAAFTTTVAAHDPLVFSRLAHQLDEYSSLPRAEQATISENEHPQVGAWNDPWATVEFLYGGAVGSYINLINEAYGETCFVSVMTLGYEMIEWAKRFNVEIDTSLWYQPALSYIIYTFNAFSVIRVGINCFEMQAESERFKWYELYPFGQPEEQTLPMVKDKIFEIKTSLIGDNIDLLLAAEGKSKKDISESDELKNWEADGARGGEKKERPQGSKDD